MQLVRIEKYTPQNKALWEDFVAKSRNGTFLHSRAFLEYHGGRFHDESVCLMLNEHVVGVFPAHRAGSSVSSHNGLTFGGLLFGIDQRASFVQDMMRCLIEYYSAAGFEKLYYKPVPRIFHKYPADDDLYALHNLGAQLVRRDLSAVIPAAGPAKVSSLRKRGKKKAIKTGLIVRAGSFFEEFYEILSQTLKRHDASPVHSLSELKDLKNRCSNSIELFGAFEGPKLVAAVLLFKFDTAIHTQYLASSERGQEIGALDFLILEISHQATQDSLAVSFGASTEKGGTILNEGLMAQKEGFGARAHALDHYELVL